MMISCLHADTEFLLSVLRTAKFSQLRAREIIENMLTMKTKLPHLLSNLDSHDPILLSFIERGLEQVFSFILATEILCLNRDWQACR